jgi:hypothetical protein
MTLISHINFDPNETVAGMIPFIVNEIPVLMFEEIHGVSMHFKCTKCKPSHNIILPLMHYN